MTGFRTCYPQIGYLSVAHILNRRSLEVAGDGRPLSDLPPWSRSQASWGSCPPSGGGRKGHLISEPPRNPRGIWTNRPRSVSPSLPPSAHPLLFWYTCPRSYISHQTWGKNAQVQRFPLISISLRRCLSPLKLILNKCVCFSLAHLSFVTEPQPRTQGESKKRYFSLPSTLLNNSGLGGGGQKHH